MSDSSLRSTLGWALFLLGLFGAFKHLSPLLPWGQEIAFFICTGFQLYVPLWLIARERSRFRDYALHCHGFFEPERPTDWAAIKKELWFTLKVCVLTFVPYGLIHYAIQSYFAGQQGLRVDFSLHAPTALAEVVLSNLLLVALPEEIFYRGFVQTRLLRVWPKLRFVFGIGIGPAIVVTSGLFALGHFVGEYQLARLLPFFPAFVFSALVLRSGSILGAVLYHTLCNTFSELLYTSTSWS